MTRLVSSNGLNKFVCPATTSGSRLESTVNELARGTTVDIFGYNGEDSSATSINFSRHSAVGVCTNLSTRACPFVLSTKDISMAQFHLRAHLAPAHGTDTAELDRRAVRYLPIVKSAARTSYNQIKPATPEQGRLHELR